MDIRRGVAALGRTMISAGVLILLFVAYQLWGTGLAEARAQRQLNKEFEALLAGPASTTTTTTAPPVTTAPAGPDSTVAATTTTTTQAPLSQGAAPPPAGDAVAIIKIPKIGVQKAVVQGVTLGLLKRGPGHYPDTPMPGQPGNAAIAGHRTTYGAPFGRLDDLEPGDPILVTTRQGRFRYEVIRSQVVSPDETSVLRQGDENLLTLTTCHPRFSASRRLIVVARLTGEAAELPEPVTTTTTTPPTTAPAPAATAPTVPTTVAPTTTTTEPASLLDLEEGGEDGLSGRSAANGPAIAWGLAAALVWLLTWLAGKRWRRWPAYLVGTPVFLVVLFVFFENFSRLLPSNY
ncbi:MAG: class E sortase [Actinomycetota bacterium]